MRETKQISHTADKAIKIKADNLEELFKGALEGMAQVQKDEPSGSGESKVETVNIEAPDQTALLIDFLSDVHTLSDIHNALFTKLEIETLSDNRLKGMVKGSKADGFNEDIKAVTHSQADIRENEDGLLETIVVFDI